VTQPWLARLLARRDLLRVRPWHRFHRPQPDLHELSLIIAAGIVLSYITLGGLSAAIYNEVLQFFVILAALVPLTTFGLIKIGGWNGLKDRVIDTLSDGEVTASVNEQLTTWPGQALSGFDSPVWSVIGIVFGLGFVLSFGVLDDQLRRSAARDGLEFDARGTPITDHRGIPEDADPIRDHRARRDRRGRDR
jgi:hypothetical protein